jgi:hypothetical protein
MIFALLKIVFQFTLHASDPHWACEITHRDPGLPATFYLYCTQTLPSGIEISSVGKYVPDAPPMIKATP